MTGGGRNKFWGGTRSLFIYIREGTVAREIYYSVDQMNKVKTKKKVFNSKISTNSSYRLKILAIFHELFREDQRKKGLRPKTFIKSGVSPQQFRKYGR